MNSVRDQITQLDLLAYQGNALAVQLTVTGTATMPTTVESVLSDGPGGRSLPASVQAVVSVTGRVITLQFPAANYAALLSKSAAFHQLKFNGRVVLAGQFRVSYDTVKSSTDQLSLTLQLDASLPINVTVLGGSIGSPDAPNNNAPDFVNTYQLFKQV